MEELPLAERESDLTLREARARYFEANDFGEDGGYSKRWVKFDVGRLTLAFPNLPSRVRAVRFHDLDHVLTGYQTDIYGECEISGYEIGTGCGSYGAGWFLNLQTFSAGLFLSPRRLLAAYQRGRQCRSLFHEEFNDALLDERVGEARSRLRLDQPVPESVSLADGVTFAGWQLVAAGLSLGMLALMLAPFYLLAVWFF